GADERVLHLLEVLGRVLVPRRVAAAHVAALEAQAQVQPFVARLHAVLAVVLVRRLHLDLSQVRALVGHGSLLSVRMTARAAHASWLQRTLSPSWKPRSPPSIPSWCTWPSACWWLAWCCASCPSWVARPSRTGPRPRSCSRARSARCWRSAPATAPTAR